MIEPVVHIAQHSGYVYPNETIIPWGVLIVFYPYVTGLVAGSFTISSLYHIFGVKAFRPIARLALLTAFSFMLFVPFFLLAHLGHPERALNAVITPNLTSAFAAFGYIAGFYIIILVLEIWFAFRPEIVARSKQLTLTGRLYRLLSLGSDDLSAHALAIDRKWIWWLAMIGIPCAHILHGYVGFVFGSLKSREWWASDMMPAIFLGSAIISGIAILVLLYVLSCHLRKTVPDTTCLRSLCYTLWGFLLFTLVLEFLEFINYVYKGREGIDMIYALLNGPIFWSVVVQVGASILSLVMLGTMVYNHAQVKHLTAKLVVCAGLILVAVFAMRWNVVIGGQELSKTLHGLLYYRPPWLGREGILMAMLIFAMPFAILAGLVKMLPPWEHDQERA